MDPGAHELGRNPTRLGMAESDMSLRFHLPTDTSALSLEEENSSESEDHFSDAKSAPLSPSGSPIPRTRVEKVSDEPSYGEVPGTDAYRLREGDAEPDEIAIVPDEKKVPPTLSLAFAGEGDADEVKSPVSPGGQPIPKTVVEEAGPQRRHSVDYERKRRADAPPDLVLKSPVEREDGEDVWGKATTGGTTSSSGAASGTDVDS